VQDLRLLVQRHRSHQPGCTSVINALIVLFISGCWLSVSLLFFRYEASELPAIIPRLGAAGSAAWLFWIGLNLVVGYVGAAGGTIFVGVLRDGVARMMKNRAFWRELNTGATITVEGAIQAVRGGPLGLVPGRATALLIFPFKDMFLRDFTSGRYHLCHLEATDILLSLAPIASSEAPAGSLPSSTRLDGIPCGLSGVSAWTRRPTALASSLRPSWPGCAVVSGMACGEVLSGLWGSRSSRGRSWRG
jgi:hypothetical protein